MSLPFSRLVRQFILLEKKQLQCLSQVWLKTTKFLFKGNTLPFILVTINPISTSLKLEDCWNMTKLASNFTLSNTSFTTGSLLLNNNHQETFNLHQTQEFMTLRGLHWILDKKNMPSVCFSTVGGVTGLDNLSQNILYQVRKNRNSTGKGRYIQSYFPQFRSIQ